MYVDVDVYVWEELCFVVVGDDWLDFVIFILELVDVVEVLLFDV